MRCQNKVTKRGYSIRCNVCLIWCHRKCTGLKVDDIRRYSRNKTTWYCGCHSNSAQVQVCIPKAKDFGRYVDEIIRTARVTDIDDIMSQANKQHPCLRFTSEREVDMMVERKLSTAWYSKPTDTGLMLYFRACAPKLYKRNIIEGTVCRINNTTSSWNKFHDALVSAKCMFERNQYQPPFYDPIVENAISKMFTQKEQRATDAKLKERKSRPTLLMEYRGHISDRFSRSIRNITEVCFLFTTRKMKTVLPSLKSNIPDDLKSRVIYEITCSGCKSSYVGQTTRHLMTRLAEHARVSSPVGSHLENCIGDASEICSKILDQTEDTGRLLTLVAPLYIARRQPTLNHRKEYRQLTLKL